MNKYEVRVYTDAPNGLPFRCERVAGCDWTRTDSARHLQRLVGRTLDYCQGNRNEYD